MRYRLLIDLDVVSLLQLLPLRRRQSLLRCFEGIQAHPRAKSDYLDHDSEGRAVNISIHEGFAIYYWIDEADRHIKILQLVSSDEGMER